MISRRLGLWIVGIVLCVILVGGITLFFTRKYLSSSNSSPFSFVDFQAEKAGISLAQLHTLDQMALSMSAVSQDEVRDMETNTFIHAQKVIFSETPTLTKPYYEPLIDQQGRVIYAFMQHCQVNTCWIDLYRDSSIASSEKGQSFVMMYMNARYALTHPRNAQELPIYFQNRDNYLRAALAILTTHPAPRVTWLDPILQLVIRPVYAGCVGDYECGRIVYKYRCPDGYDIGTCTTTSDQCRNSQTDAKANCIQDGTTCESTNSKSCSTKDTVAKCNDGTRGACSVSECTDGLSYGCSWGGTNTSPTNTPAPGQPTSAPVPASTAPFPAFKGHFA